MSSETDNTWKDDVQRKLNELFEEDADSLSRLLFHLNKDATAGITAPSWRTLKTSLASEQVFKSYAERLIEDTKRAEVDEEFKKSMRTCYENMMDASEDPVPEKACQGFDVARVTQLRTPFVSGLIGFARAWEMVPISSQTDLLSLIGKILPDQQIFSMVDHVSGCVNKAGASFVTMLLTTIYMGYQACKNIFRWFKGEISGKRCAKNLIDTSVTIGVGIGAGMLVVLVGSPLGPFFSLVGGAGAGFIASQVTQVLIDKLTQILFGIPKDEALENAYNFFGVKMSASNNEINKVCRQFCLKHHPDKGGKNDNFILVQRHIRVIRVARGEMY